MTEPEIAEIYPTKAGFGETQRLYTEAELQAAIAAAMMGAVKPLEWDHDGRRLRMDGTMAFSKGYDWDAYEAMRQEGYGLAHAYIIWPDTYGSKHWNVYGVFDGLYIHNCDGEDAAKAAAQADYQARILSALSIPTDALAALEAVKAQVRDEALEMAAAKVEDHLHDWAGDLAATRDDLISAQTSGVWNGRKVHDKTWLKQEARKFGDRAEAVAESVDHAAAAIRAMKEVKE